MATVPIVLIHRGSAAHLRYAAAQAKASNPKADVVLLGDGHHRFLKFIHHEDLASYSEEALEFEKQYIPKHLSPNEIPYELICFQRWFMLKQFMQMNRVERCIYLDSDVMLYSKVAEEVTKFSAYDFTLSRRTCAHNSFWTSSGISKFCNFLMSFYTEPEGFEILKSIRGTMLANSSTAGISDMTLFNQFAKKHPDRVGETSEILNGSTYDQNINQSDGFEMQNGMKKIYWIDRKPFAQHTVTNQKIQLNTLHFQGPAKKLMRDYYTGSLLRLRSQVFYGKVLSRMQGITSY